MEKFRADAAIQSHAARHVANISADLFAKIGDLVDESDLGGEEGIGGVFDQFAAFAAGEQDRRLAQIKRPIDFAHHVARLFGIAANHHPVRAAEIADGRAFAQEFGIGGHVEIGAGAHLADDGFDLAAGADRYGGFGDDNGVAGKGGGDLFRRGEDIRQVGMAVATPAGRAHGDEDGARTGNGGGEIAFEGEASGLDVGGHDLVQAGLENGNGALAQASDLGCVLVDADHIMAEFRQAGPGHQADIARANHGYSHQITSKSGLFWPG